MASHPYYPVDAVLAGYEPNAVALPTVLALFGSLAGAVVLVAYATAARQPGLRSLDRFAAAWFALCKCLPASLSAYGQLQLTNLLTTFSSHRRVSAPLL